MHFSEPIGRSSSWQVRLGAVLLAIVGAVPWALAGSCAEEQVLTEPRDLEAVSGEGVQADVEGQIDLTGWRDMGNFRLRMRKIVIEPGGIVATHDHGDRPSIVLVLDGTLVEHNAYCSEPITHLAGEVSVETGEGHRHWWENPTDQAVTVYSSDVVPFEAPDDSADM